MQMDFIELLQKHIKNPDVNYKSLKTSSVLKQIVKSTMLEAICCRYPIPILAEILKNKNLKSSFVKKYDYLLDHYQIPIPQVDQLEPEIVSIRITSWTIENREFLALIQKENPHLTLPKSYFPYQSELNLYKKDLNLFLDKYNYHTNLDWSHISKQNLSKSKHLIINHLLDWNWNWKEISKNKTIVWDFDFLEIIKEKVDWRFVLTHNSLFWDIESIKRFKKNISFTNINVRHPKGSKRISYTDSFKKEKYFIDDFEKDTYVGMSLSFLPNVNWNDDLIREFENDWDWQELSYNESIRWDSNLIYKYRDNLNFQSLSRNKNIDWSETLVDQYKDKWDWGLLSGNPSLPWCNEFVDKYADKWKWTGSNFKYEEYNNNYFDSLSLNTGIFWNKLAIKKYLNKINIWQLTLGSKFDNEYLIQLKNKLNQKEIIGYRLHRYSDFGWEFENEYKTCWENLVNNQNFKLSLSIIDTLKDNTFDQIYVDGNLVKGADYKTRKVKILSLYIEKEITTVDEESLIEYQLLWHKIFLDNQFINTSILSTVIIPYLLKTDNLIRFMDSLSKITTKANTLKNNAGRKVK